MLKWSVFLTAAVALFLLGSAPAAQAADGKALFTELKCNSCHPVASQGIAVAKSEDEEAEEGDTGKSDLSGAGVTRDAGWLKDWLAKKVDVDGKKHRKKFDGTPEQLDVLANWLATLKEPAKK